MDNLAQLKKPLLALAVCGPLAALGRRSPLALACLVVSAVAAGFFNVPPRFLQSLGALLRRAPLEMMHLYRKVVGGESLSVCVIS